MDLGGLGEWGEYEQNVKSYQTINKNENRNQPQVQEAKLDLGWWFSW